jgi:hypothetical protein
VVFSAVRAIYLLDLAARFDYNYVTIIIMGYAALYLGVATKKGHEDEKNIPAQKKGKGQGTRL